MCVYVSMYECMYIYIYTHICIIQHNMFLLRVMAPPEQEPASVAAGVSLAS